MANRTLDCSICAKPVLNLTKRRFRKLVLSDELPTHAKCRRMIERRGELKNRGGARLLEAVAVPGVAGVTMQWQIRRSRSNGRPLAKAIVNKGLASTYVRNVKASDEMSE